MKNVKCLLQAIVSVLGCASVLLGFPYAANSLGNLSNTSATVFLLLAIEFLSRVKL